MLTSCDVITIHLALGEDNEVETGSREHAFANKSVESSYPQFAEIISQQKSFGYFRSIKPHRSIKIEASCFEMILGE